MNHGHFILHIFFCYILCLIISPKSFKRQLFKVHDFSEVGFLISSSFPTCTGSYDQVRAVTAETQVALPSTEGGTFKGRPHHL